MKRTEKGIEDILAIVGAPLQQQQGIFDDLEVLGTFGGKNKKFGFMWMEGP